MDAPRRYLPRPDLRVGDADRKAAVDELQQHYVEGRLTSEELGERVSHALAAKTFGDLAALLSDLPPLNDALAMRDSAPPHADHDSWHLSSFSPSLGLIIMLIGVLVLLAVFVLPSARFFFPWPLLIWGFFFIGGRPRHRRF
jgi:hypothetical protein